MEEIIQENDIQEETSSNEVTREDIDRLIRRHVYSSMAVGLIPIPVVDFLAVSGIQLNLVRKLSKIYNIPFSKESTKNIIISLVGGSIPAVTGQPVASSIKFIPIIGQSLGAVSMPLIAGASTFAVGKVFYRHFAAGGTFLTFDVEKAKAYYDEMFQKGKALTTKMQVKTA